MNSNENQIEKIAVSLSTMWIVILMKMLNEKSVTYSELFRRELNMESLFSKHEHVQVHEHEHEQSRSLW